MCRNPTKFIDSVKLSWIPHSVCNVFARSLSLCVCLFRVGRRRLVFCCSTTRWTVDSFLFGPRFFPSFQFPAVGRLHGNLMPSTGGRANYDQDFSPRSMTGHCNKKPFLHVATVKFRCVSGALFSSGFSVHFSPRLLSKWKSNISPLLNLQLNFRWFCI